MSNFQFKAVPIKTLLLLSYLLLTNIQIQAQSLVMGSYNLRFDDLNDKKNAWKDRSVAIKALIRFHNFDIIGTQEAFDSQLQDLITALPQYNVYGKGRDDGTRKGEHSAILYKKDRFTLLNQGDFWLSATPNQPSLGWDATCCNRLCSWVYLKDRKTKKSFYVFNAHYDHIGKQARIESSKLILAKVTGIAGNKPVIFTGDLNGDQNSEPYQIIKNSVIFEDSFELVDYPYATTNSYNGFGANLNGNTIIDHVFVSKHFEVKRWGVLTDSYNGKYPSDHFPILSEVILKK
jgi:endonuclease/exonuclease/phosphatase family metal-dependent hydrolase